MFHTIDLYLNEDEAGLLKAILLGEKQFLGEEVKEDHRVAGLAHLMAVSGLHIGFVVFSIFFTYPLTFRFFYKYFPASMRACRARKAPVLHTLLAIFFLSGYRNPFHHPHPNVVEHYENSGAKIWRTDLYESITITTKGYEHQIQGYEDL